MADPNLNISPEELREVLENSRSLQRTVEEQSQQIKELSGLLKDTQGPRVLRAITDRKVRVRRVSGKVVVGYKNRGVESRPQYVYDKTDPNDRNRTLLWVDLILEDGSVLSVNYNDFLREAESVECKVVKTETKEWVLEQGYVKKKEVEAYSTIELPVEVPVEIKGVVRLYTVTIPDDGREVTLHEDFVNI